MSKINNKGQTLALFIILIPLIILLGSYAIDIGYMKYNENKLNSINEMAVEYVLDNIDSLQEGKTEELISQNDDEINDVSIDVNTEEKTVKITLSKNFKGVFGNFVDKDIYEAKSTYKGTIIDDEKKIERVR